jgi:predicted nucleotidyltransferase
MTMHPAVQTMVDRIAQQFNPVRILLFGSHSRGTAGAGSDVDLLVVLAEVNDKRRTTVEIRRALGDLPLSKDIIVTTPAEIATRGNLVGSILRPALLEGRTVYERV